MTAARIAGLVGSSRIALARIDQNAQSGDNDNGECKFTKILIAAAAGFLVGGLWYNQYSAKPG
jgi:hypothetical protein